MRESVVAIEPRRGRASIMVNNQDLVTARKKAYTFMFRKVKQMGWIPIIDADTKLADALDIDISEIISLKSGKSNHSTRLIDRCKNLFEQIAREEDIKAYLITPFK